MWASLCKGQKHRFLSVACCPFSQQFCFSALVIFCLWLFEARQPTSSGESALASTHPHPAEQGLLNWEDSCPLSAQNYIRAQSGIYLPALNNLPERKGNSTHMKLSPMTLWVPQPSTYHISSSLRGQLHGTL